MQWMLMLLVLIITIAPAQAYYIDPGSGSYLFQIAVATVFGCCFAVRQCIHKWCHRHHDEHTME